MGYKIRTIIYDLSNDVTLDDFEQISNIISTSRNLSISFQLHLKPAIHISFRDVRKRAARNSDPT